MKNTILPPGFPQKFFKERQRIGLSLDRAAELFDLNRSTVFRWHKGQTAPTKLELIGAMALLAKQPDRPKLIL